MRGTPHRVNPSRPRPRTGRVPRQRAVPPPSSPPGGRPTGGTGCLMTLVMAPALLTVAAVRRHPRAALSVMTVAGLLMIVAGAIMPHARVAWTEQWLLPVLALAGLLLYTAVSFLIPAGRPVGVRSAGRTLNARPQAGKPPRTAARRAGHRAGWVTTAHAPAAHATPGGRGARQRSK